MVQFNLYRFCELSSFCSVRSDQAPWHVISGCSVGFENQTKERNKQQISPRKMHIHLERLWGDEKTAQTDGISVSMSLTSVWKPLPHL